MQIKYIFFFLFLLYCGIVAQQEDTIKTYDLSEITVQAGIAIEPKQITKFDQEFLTAFDGGSIFETGYFMPSIKPQTNSRGESLFYIRGSSERQLGLFFDGAFINIPWDNRIDLSLLPTNSISELQIIKGIPSITYGANQIAGVIIGTSQKKLSSNLTGSVSGQFGNYNQRKLSLSIGKSIGKLSLYFSASHYNRDAYILPQNFSSEENPTEQRINSYQETNGLFAKAGYNYEKSSSIQASFQYLSSSKGVPPEIDVKNARYWQYPIWEKIGVTVFGNHAFDSFKNTYIDYVFNIYNFKMQIDDFTDRTYSVISDVEKNNDAVLYGRFNFTTLLGSNSIIRLSFSGYNTNHKEQFLSTNFDETLYTQYVYSTGIEYEFLSNRITAILGIGYDGSSFTETGNFDDSNNLSSLGFNLTTKYQLDNALSLQLNLGKKSRFPSLRESYSDGLGRFIVNPDLKQETAYDGELGLQFLFPKGSMYTNIFLNLLSDGIVRDFILVNDETKFTRVNKESIRTFGFELQFDYSIANKVSAGFQFSYLNSSSKNTQTGKYTDTLEYKPDFISSLYLNYSPWKRISGLLELTTIHNEFGYQEGYEYFRELPSYFLINFRLTYSIPFDKTKQLQFFGRINNIFDKLYYTQWGLPEAGRQFYAGLNFSF